MMLEIEVSWDGPQSTSSPKESSHTWDRLWEGDLDSGTQPPLPVVPLEGLDEWSSKAGGAPQLQSSALPQLGKERERSKRFFPFTQIVRGETQVQSLKLRSIH